MALDKFSDSFGPGTPFWELGDEIKTRLAGMVEGGYERGELTEQLTQLVNLPDILELPTEQMGEGVTDDKFGEQTRDYIGTPLWNLADKIKNHNATLLAYGEHTREEIRDCLLEFVQGDEMYEASNAGAAPDGAADFNQLVHAGNKDAALVNKVVTQAMAVWPITKETSAYWETFTRTVTSSLNVIVAELKRQHNLDI